MIIGIGLQINNSATISPSHPLDHVTEKIEEIAAADPRTSALSLGKPQRSCQSRIRRSASSQSL